MGQRFQCRQPSEQAFRNLLHPRRLQGDARSIGNPLPEPGSTGRSSSSARRDEVREVDTVPAGGTGKPNWQVLRSQVLQKGGNEASGA
jgi:hypothetical protein